MPLAEDAAQLGVTFSGVEEHDFAGLRGVRATRDIAAGDCRGTQSVMPMQLIKMMPSHDHKACAGQELVVVPRSALLTAQVLQPVLAELPDSASHSVGSKEVRLQQPLRSMHHLLTADHWQSRRLSAACCCSSAAKGASLHTAATSRRCQQQSPCWAHGLLRPSASCRCAHTS